jgi:hypothetical protein
MKACWWSGGIASRILDLGEWSASRPYRFIPAGSNVWYPLDGRLGGPQSRSGRGDEKNSQPLPGIQT